MRYIVTGGAGFIGSHLVDRLVLEGNSVIVLDNLLAGFGDQVNAKAKLVLGDITKTDEFIRFVADVNPDGIFHCSAIARTPWCLDEPVLCAQTNVIGTLNVLEAARKVKVKRVVLSSSNVVYAAMTPYRASKEQGEQWGQVYAEMYGVSNISLRYSNVYGPRQSEIGPSPNVFAAFRKSHRQHGYIIVTGDGEQSRDFTHVYDINRAQILAMQSDYVGPAIDLCTGKNWTMNEVVKMFSSVPKYVDDRPGDVKHIVQEWKRAYEILKWKSQIALPDGIVDCL